MAIWSLLEQSSVCEEFTLKNNFFIVFQILTHLRRVKFEQRNIYLHILPEIVKFRISRKHMAFSLLLIRISELKS